MLRANGGLLTGQVTAVQASLFIGTALSITAFPVLARIIGERGIAGTSIGSLALSAGAIDDAFAWMILAVVLGTLTGRASPAIVAVVGAAGYALVMLSAVPPLLQRVLARDSGPDAGVSPATIATVVGVLMLGAWFTETIGLHAVFGAFLFGVSFRRGALALELRRLIEPLVGSIFVPLFFVYAGLHTELRLLDSPWLWAIAVADLRDCVLRQRPGLLARRVLGRRVGA